MQTQTEPIVGTDAPTIDNSLSPEPPVSLLKRMREAAGTVYGDIGTSVLYTTMEITRETVILKHHHLPREEQLAHLANGGQLLTPTEAMGGLSLVYWALIFLTVK